MIFSKRRGEWKFYAFESFNFQLANKKKNTYKPEIRKAILETSIDVSYNRSGGCIAVVKSNDKKYQSHIDSNDLIDNLSTTKTKLLNTMIKGLNFQNLDRIVRQEIVALDGATIIDTNGKIIAAGAILKIDAGSTGGGRLAATKTMGKYGVSIKISADGEIRIFGEDKTSDIKEIFKFS